MTALALRQATVADAALLAELNAQLIEDEGLQDKPTDAELLVRMMTWLTSGYVATIAEAESEPVAYLLWRPEPPAVYLRQFFVQRAWRRKGIGREVMAAATTRLWPGLRVDLDVLVVNEHGQDFWRSLGFEVYSHRLRLDTHSAGK
jgi:ribosomal protein S18 acetylase RimI-like enzyme